MRWRLHMRNNPDSPRHLQVDTIISKGSREMHIRSIVGRKSAWKVRDADAKTQIGKKRLSGRFAIATRAHASATSARNATKAAS